MSRKAFVDVKQDNLLIQMILSLSFNIRQHERKSNDKPDVKLSFYVT